MNIRKHHIIIAIILIFVAILLILFLYSPADAYKKDMQIRHDTLAEKIQKNLNDVPEYGVFDWITFEVRDDGKVALKGWVIFEETRSEAHKAIDKIDGVLEIDDQIIVLPNSKLDNNIRNSAWAKIEKDPKLENLVEGEDPKVHIIVNHKKVSLFGKVKNKNEATLIETTIKKIQGVAEVENNLEVK